MHCRAKIRLFYGASPYGHHPERYAERMSGPWPPLAGQLHGHGYEPRGLRWHVVKQAIGEMTEAGDRQSHMRFTQWASFIEGRR